MWPLTANDGLLDRDADIITLNGDVTLFHDNGLSFQTDSATINLKDKTAEGSDVVEGQNGDGELISQGFRVRDDGDTIEFTGKAYMKIYPKKAGGAGRMSPGTSWPCPAPASGDDEVTRHPEEAAGRHHNVQRRLCGVDRQ